MLPRKIVRKIFSPWLQGDKSGCGPPLSAWLDLQIALSFTSESGVKEKAAIEAEKKKLKADSVASRATGGASRNPSVDPEAA